MFMRRNKKSAKKNKFYLLSNRIASVAVRFAFRLFLIVKKSKFVRGYRFICCVY